MDELQDIVLITAMSEGIIVKGIERKLKDIGLKVCYSLPMVNELSIYDEKTAVYIIYLSADIDYMMDALVYINDVVKQGEKDLIVICENSEKLELNRSISNIQVSKWILRPLDMPLFVEEVTSVLESRLGNRENKSILVVDDDPSYVQIVREWLKDDYQVFCVTSGMQAISFLMKRSVDLILLDYEMPITTGPQVFRMLRSEEDTSGMPIVFLTGIGDVESVKEVIKLKPDGYILKSTTKPDLLKWIRLFFDKRLY
ncbi:MAG: response regulator [Lachnospiraceae bacterium]|nr:response regulator [Lachnospiraceae bacterium]